MRARRAFPPLLRAVCVPGLLLAMAAGASLAPGPASAQDVGLVAVHAVSGNPELPSPSGLGAEAWFGATDWRARVTLLRYGDDTEKDGQVCVAPGIGCTVETVDTSARLTGLRVEMFRTFRVAGGLELAAGGGAGFSQVRATAMGSSGRAAAVHIPNTGQVGFLGSAALTARPVSSIPVSLVAGITEHWMRWNGCVDPGDPTRGYAPFCGWDRIVEVRAGLTVTLPRR